MRGSDGASISDPRHGGSQRFGRSQRASAAVAPGEPALWAKAGMWWMHFSSQNMKTITFEEPVALEGALVIVRRRRRRRNWKYLCRFIYSDYLI